MALLNTDLFLVERGGAHYKMEAALLPEFLDSPVTVSAVAPTSPLDGDLWFDTTTGLLKIWIVVEEIGSWISTSSIESFGFYPDRAIKEASVSIKLNEAISVKDYGAVGDGVADDTDAIQAALQAVTPWRRLVFPAGTYRVTESMVIPYDSAGNSGIVIEGQEYGARIVATMDAPIFIGEASYITFRNLFLDGGAPLPNSNRCGIRMSGDKATIGSSKFVGLNVSGCRFLNLFTAIETSVNNCRIINNTAEGVYQFVHSVDGFSDSVITNNIVTSGSWTGSVLNEFPYMIHLGYAENSPSSINNVSIFENIIVNSIDSVDTRVINLTGGNNISIYNNILECNTLTTPINKLSGVIFGEASIYDLSNLSIINNRLKIGPRNELESNIVLLNSVNSDQIAVENVLIDGNSFGTVDELGHGIHMSGIFNYSIVNNVIEGTFDGPTPGVGFADGPTYIEQSIGGRFNNNYDKYNTGDPLTCPFRVNLFPAKTTIKNTTKSLIGSTDSTKFYGGNYHELLNDLATDAVIFADTSPMNTYTGCLLQQRSLYKAGDTVWSFVDSSNDSFRILGNGNFININNSYGALSDITLKENITPADSQWALISNVRFHKYTLRQDSTHRDKLGVIAQELELLCPELVNTIPERDLFTGEPNGEYVKSVNYSELFKRSVGALQETLKRIEKLQKEIDDLENTPK
jgi:hypothetical protein